MARSPRLVCHGLPFHVMVRGNNGDPIFLKEDHFLWYLDLLAYYKQRLSFSLHTFCLMTNHIHLLIETAEPYHLDRVMHRLNTSYTMHFNKALGRTGHVMQGRYKSILVEKDQYLLAVIRYIHLNPIKAGLTQGLEEYPWSGHFAYVGQRWQDLVDLDLGLGLLHSNPQRQLQEYQMLMRDGLAEREGLHEQMLKQTQRHGGFRSSKPGDGYLT